MSDDGVDVQSPVYPEEYDPAFERERDALLLVAVLVKKLGGEVTITVEELRQIAMKRTSRLVRYDDPSTLGLRFKVIDE